MAATVDGAGAPNMSFQAWTYLTHNQPERISNWAAPRWQVIKDWGSWFQHRALYATSLAALTVLMHWHPGWSTVVFCGSLAYSEELRPLVDKVIRAVTQATWWECIAIAALALWNMEKVTPFVLSTFSAMYMGCHLSRAEPAESLSHLVQNIAASVVAEGSNEPPPEHPTRLQRLQQGAESCRLAVRPILLGIAAWAQQINDDYAITQRISAASERIVTWSTRILALAFFRLNPPLTAITTIFSTLFSQHMRLRLDRITRVWTNNHMFWRAWLVANAAMTVQVSPICIGMIAAASLGTSLGERVAVIG